MLPDHEIHELVDRGDLGIDPFDPGAVQPASVDLRLDHTLKVLQPGRERGPVTSRSHVGFTHGLPAGHR